MVETDLTLEDIEQLVILVQIKGNCHQVFMSKDDKNILKHFIASMTSGLKLSQELQPIILQPIHKSTNN